MRDMAEEIPEATQTPQPIVARYAKYHRNKQYLLVLLFFGFGIACIYHGFFIYPKQNAAAISKGQNPPHAEYDAPLNKLLGIILPPLAIFVLWRTLYTSRGEYRLEGQTLHIPGHPRIPLSAIRTIDKKLWDRKGIALIEYELSEGGERKKFRVDDVVYEREPTDRIMDQI